MEDIPQGCLMHEGENAGDQLFKTTPVQAAFEQCSQVPS